MRVKELEVGDAIAVLDDNAPPTPSYTKRGSGGVTPLAFEKIASITKVGRKRTYDLQIANTHNFVAGHYVDTTTGKALTEEEERFLNEYLSLGFEIPFELTEEQHSQQHEGSHAKYGNGETDSKIINGVHTISSVPSSFTAATVNRIAADPWWGRMRNEMRMNISLDQAITLVNKLY